jgi:hypothetical protein
MAGFNILDILKLKPLTDRLWKWLGRDIFVKAIYLRTSDKFGLLNLKISNDSGHPLTINAFALSEVNGEKAYAPKIISPFELEDKKYKLEIIEFEGKLHEGKNTGRVIVAVEDFKGRRTFVKKFSVFLNKG